MTNIILGDCLVELKKLPENSVDSIVTDPPYGLSFMGKKWDYDVPKVEVWIEAIRVLKPGGHLLSFGGTRTYHRMVVAIEDAGFEIRDMVSWVYGSGFPKSLNLKAVMPGFGTALKPAVEPICLARKPLSEKTVASNVLKWGTGGINIDGCRVGTETLVNEYCAKKEGYMSDGEGASGGAFSKDGSNTVVGRFPANLLHDGSDEVVGLFPNTKSGVIKPYTEKPQNPSSFNFAGRKKPAFDYADPGSASRFFYCAKSSKSERNRGLEGMGEKENAHSTYGIHSDEGLEWNGRNPENRSRKMANHHPTVKPIALMRYLCRLITPKGGTVLDPFMGSGSTGIGAELEGFNFIGIEREEEYVKIAESRIAAWEKPNTLL